VICQGGLRPPRTPRGRWGSAPPAPRPLSVVALVAIFLFGACTEAPLRVAPSRDAEAGAKLARDAGALLLQFAAYDYGLAGALSSAKARTVTPARYGVVARGAAKTISAHSAGVVGAAVDRVGPIRDKLVTLADGLTDLGRDAQSYADAGDPAAFARVISHVTAGWQRLRDLSTALPRDDVLESAIARGTSFVVTASAATKHTVTVGPYTTVADAEQALKAIGSPQNAAVTRTAPFVVRLGPYADADAAALVVAKLASQGIVSLVSQDQSYTFARSGPVPDVELWREPSRVLESAPAARRIALSDDGTWILTGSDGGQAALFDPADTLRALPQSFAGMSALAFSDDARFFALGGQTLTFLTAPAGQVVGTPMRFNNVATQLLFVPTTRLFVATSKGPTGEPSGGAGVIGGRAPDGVPLGDCGPTVEGDDDGGRVCGVVTPVWASAGAAVTARITSSATPSRSSRPRRARRSRRPTPATSLSARRAAAATTSRSSGPAATARCARWRGSPGPGGRSRSIAPGRRSPRSPTRAPIASRSPMRRR